MEFVEIVRQGKRLCRSRLQETSEYMSCRGCPLEGNTFCSGCLEDISDTDIREADFISVVTWRQLAENCGKYLAKGKKAAVEGAIQTRSYQAQDGTKRYVTEVVAEQVEFLSPQGKPVDPPPLEDPPEDPPEGFTEIDDDELPF